MLSTGQMIDTIKIGNEAKRSWSMKGDCHDRFTKAKKDIYGDLVFWDNVNKCWENEGLSDSLIDSQWKLTRK